MSQCSALNPQSEADELEAAVDQAIAACCGDMRAAMRALVMANSYLRSENGNLTRAVSPGFVRRQRPLDQKDLCE